MDKFIHKQDYWNKGNLNKSVTEVMNAVVGMATLGKCSAFFQMYLGPDGFRTEDMKISDIFRTNKGWNIHDLAYAVANFFDALIAIFTAGHYFGSLKFYTAKASRE